MNELTVFVGGSVGSDPYAPGTWSGLSVYLLDAMKKSGLLDKAVGLRVPRLTNYALLAKNFTRNRAVWRRHFYFDPAYRAALTRTAAKTQWASPVGMQIGGMFSLPQAFPQKKTVSYSDGNLAQTVASGFGLQGVSAKRIDQTLRYEEELAGQLTAVLTFSEYLRQSFIHDYHVPAERVFAVGGGVNLWEVPEENPAKDYTKPRVLFIGVEFERKGGTHLLEAFRAVRAEIPAAELNIVGPSSLPSVPEGVVFHGRLAKGDPAQKAKLEGLLRECSLFVLPSLYEPFGIAPLEAMLYQTPAIVTNDWALRETVTPGVTGELVQKGSAESLAAALVRVLKDPEGMARMGAAARKTVLERYTWPAVVERIAGVVRAL